jgi:hypothetical protein
MSRGFVLARTGEFPPNAAMFFVRVFLACTLLPACSATFPQPPTGMPQDKELSPGRSDEALTVR